MTKHTITIEIEVPDDVSDCWIGPHAGPQIFHDVFVRPSLAYLTGLYGSPSSSEELKQYIKTKIQVLTSLKY